MTIARGPFRCPDCTNAWTDVEVAFQHLPVCSSRRAHPALRAAAGIPIPATAPSVGATARFPDREATTLGRSR